MDTEPHDITTVSIRAFPPKPPENRSLQDYQADLVRKFGRVPSWTELAKRENRAMLNRQAQSPMARTQASRGDETHRIAKLQEALAAKSEATRQRILSALAEPKTATDLSTILKISEHGVRKHLNELLERGEVVRFFLQRCAVWRLAERKLEAAE